MMYITCLIGLAPANRLDLTSPINPLLRKTCCVKLYNRRSSGMSIRLRLPDIKDPLYCPPCPRPAGKRSFGELGARPELLTITEEFSTPVPLPFATIRFCPTTTIAAGYWPVGIKPFSFDFSSPLCASATTATALLCALATKSVFSSALNARLSGLPPGKALSARRVLTRSISRSAAVSITETLSAFELTTYRRVFAELKIIDVGWRSTAIRRTGLFGSFGSITASAESFQQETYTLAALPSRAGKTATPYG